MRNVTDILNEKINHNTNEEFNMVYGSNDVELGSNKYVKYIVSKAIKDGVTQPNATWLDKQKEMLISKYPNDAQTIMNIGTKSIFPKVTLIMLQNKI